MWLGSKRVLSVLLLVAGCAAPGTAVQPAAPPDPPAREESAAAVQDHAAEAQILLVQGMTRAYLRDHAGALERLEEALRLAPNEPAILSAISESYSAQGNLTTALYYAEQAVRLDPGHLYYRSQLADLLQRSGAPQQAADTYRALLEQEPRNTEALRELSRIQAAAGQHASAAETLEQLRLLLRDDLYVLDALLHEYSLLADTTGLIRTLHTLVDLEPAGIDNRRRLAELLHRRQRDEEAIKTLEGTLRLFPDDVESALLLGTLYRRAGRADEAAALLNQMRADTTGSPRPVEPDDTTPAQGQTGGEIAAVLERVVLQEPHNVAALRELALLRLEQNNYAEAGDLLYRMVQEDPRDPGIWVQAVGCMIEAGEAARAARVAAEGLLLFPGEIALLRKGALAHLDAGDSENARELLTEALAIYREEATPDPHQEAILLADLGVVEATRKRPQAADSLFSAAHRLDPTHPYLLERNAVALVIEGRRLADAQRMAEKAVSLEPANPVYLETAGWIYAMTRDFGKAERFFVRATEHDQVSGRVFDRYGDMLARKGDRQKALSMWRKALERSPRNEALRRKLEGS